MGENLLLGNGINLDLGISELRPEAIFQRFQDILIKTSPLYEFLTGKGFDMQICNSIFADCQSSAEKLGIEALARNVYNYLKNTVKWSQNNERELKDFIAVSAINAIFYNGDSTINIAPITNDTNKNKVATLKAYKNIFTINYAEFWDSANKCCFLHGNYILPEFSSIGKDIILFCPYNDASGTYKRIIDRLESKYFMNEYFPEVVFTPLTDKQDSIYDGHVPCMNLFPGLNTFPSKIRQLYIELNDIESLDVFGMSPLGDDRLIQRLSVVPSLKIYVYNMDKIQVDKWNDLLNRECCVDSSSFYAY